MSSYVTYTVETVPHASRAALVAVSRKFGFVPVLLGKLAGFPAALTNYRGVAAAFAALSLTPAEQQVVSMAVNVFHACEYCTAAHSLAVLKAGLDRGTVDALREQRPLSDPRIEALRVFTLALTEGGGCLRPGQTEVFLAAAFEQAQVLDMLTGPAARVISNYGAYLTDPPLDEAMRNASCVAPNCRAVAA